MKWRAAVGVLVLTAVLAGCGGSEENVVAETGNPGAGASVGASGTGSPSPDSGGAVAGSSGAVGVGTSSPSASTEEPMVDLDAGVSSPPNEAPAGKAKPGTTAGAEVVKPRKGMDNLHTVTIDKTEVRGEKTIRVYFYGGVEPCSVLDSVEVSETAKTITITLRSGSDPAHPDAMCIQIAKYKAVDVTLDAPVGDREIVDGSAEN
jgi:hypothetical protein